LSDGGYQNDKNKLELMDDSNTECQGEIGGKTGVQTTNKQPEK
jgi:hypothetical protein